MNAEQLLEIEKLENLYLEEFYHFLKFVERRMLRGFDTKEKIKDDWIDKWEPNEEGKGISSFAEGDEQRMMLMGLKRFTKYVNLPNIVGLKNVIADKVTEANKYPFTIS